MEINRVDTGQAGYQRLNFKIVLFGKNSAHRLKAVHAETYDSQ